MNELWKRILFSVGIAALAGCAGSQSALDPAGVQATRIGRLWWLFLGITAVIYLLVMLFTLVPLGRARLAAAQMKSDPPILSPDAKKQRRMTMIVSGSLAITVLIML